jgi:hypothetical protein
MARGPKTQTMLGIAAEYAHLAERAALRAQGAHRRGKSPQMP